MLTSITIFALMARLSLSIASLAKPTQKMNGEGNLTRGMSTETI